MAKGNVAKTEVVRRLKASFGEDFIGEVDKKIYLWVKDEGNEKVQIAITLTCPKVPIAAPGVSPIVSNSKGFDFEAAPAPTPKVEVTQDEQKNIADLLARLGL